jgi:hypothetical protein
MGANMPTTKAAKRAAHRSRTHLWPLRPQVTGAAVVLAAAAALAMCAATLPHDFVLPAMTMLFFILAAVVALVASNADRAEEAGLTHSDIAGLLTFIGICAASQVDPDQMLRLVEGANREP